MFRTKQTTNRGFVAIAGLALAAAWAAAPRAEAQQVTPIDNCGAVLTTPGLYSVPSALESSSDTSDCIQINGSGIILVLQANLSGPGGASATAAGIHVTSSARGIAIAAGTTATIQGFGTGILVEGTGVSVSANGTTTFQTQGNVAQGVLVENASNVVIQNLTSAANGQAGLEVLNSSGVTVQGQTTLESNSGHGLWVNASTGNQFFDIQSLQNSGDGIYVGTAEPSASAALKSEFHRPRAPKCPACLSTTATQPNAFIDGLVSGNKGTGILIDAGQTSNIISAMGGSANAASDAVDKNNNCTANTWTGNAFEDVSPSCIH